MSNYTLFYESYTDPDSEPEMLNNNFKSLKEAWDYAIEGEYINYEIGLKRDGEEYKLSHPHPDTYTRWNLSNSDFALNGVISIKPFKPASHAIYVKPNKIRKYKIYMITISPIEAMYVIKGDRQKIMNRFDKIVERYQKSNDLWI